MEPNPASSDEDDERAWAEALAGDAEEDNFEELSSSSFSDVDAYFESSYDEMDPNDVGANGADVNEPREAPPPDAALVLPAIVERYFTRKMNGRLRKLINKTVLDHMRKIAAYCTWLLVKLLSKDPATHRLPTQRECRDIRKCYDQWYELWITHSTWINELRFIRIPALFDTPEEQLDQDGLRKVRSALGESIFPELCRMWFLLHYGELYLQKQELIQREINVDELILEDVPTVHWALCHTTSEFWYDTWPQLWPKSDDDAFAREKTIDTHAVRPRKSSPLWDKPVMSYTQYEIYQAVMLLTERIDDYPCDNEIVRLIMVLFTRLSTFFCQAAPESIFDKPDLRCKVPGHELYVPNRKFIMWSNIYFYELHRRVFWLRLISKKQLAREGPLAGPLAELDATLVARVRAWVHDSLDRIGEEEFEDLYATAMEEHYEFPGDDNFIQYGHLEGSVSRGDTLMELRPTRQGYRYFEDEHLSHVTILANVKRADTYLYRLMIFMSIDNYFLTKGLSWRTHVVIDQCSIEMSNYQLLRAKEPMIVHVFNRPWVSYKGRVLTSGDIYETLAAWFLILDKTCNGIVFRNDISDVVETVLHFEIPNADTQRRNIDTDDPLEQPPKAGDIEHTCTVPDIELLKGQVGILKFTI